MTNPRKSGRANRSTGNKQAGMPACCQGEIRRGGEGREEWEARARGVLGRTSGPLWARGAGLRGPKKEIYLTINVV